MTSTAAYMRQFRADHPDYVTRNKKRAAARTRTLEKLARQSTSGAYSASVENASIVRINNLILWTGAMAGTFNTLVDALVNAGIIDA